MKSLGIQHQQKYTQTHSSIIKLSKFQSLAHSQAHQNNGSIQADVICKSQSHHVQNVGFIILSI